MSWKNDMLRMFAIFAGASALGLFVNPLTPHPVPAILAADGPGALPEREPRIGTEELRSALSGAILILDVRSDEAYARGHPANCLHIPEEDLANRYNELSAAGADAAELVVVVCDSDQCTAGDRAAKWLVEIGGLKAPVKVFQGGWETYGKSDLPKEGVQ